MNKYLVLYCFSVGYLNLYGHLHESISTVVLLP